MRTLILSLLLLPLSTLSFSQVNISASRDLNNFDKLNVTGKFPVYIIPSNENRAEVKTYNKEVSIDNLSFSYSGTTLNIKYKGSFVKEIDLELTLYYDGQIPTVEARRGAEIHLENVGEINRTVSYTADSGSKILAQKIQTQLLKAKVSKGGSIQLEGTAEIFEPSISAGGLIASIRLLTNEVNATVKLGGEIICAPQKILNAKITSGGTISYTGDPVVNQTIKLGGKVEKL